MHGIIMFARSNREITVTRVLMYVCSAKEDGLKLAIKGCWD